MKENVTVEKKRANDAQAWLEVGAHDLAAARKLASGEDPNLNYASYFCQQTAEKALKALLVFNGVEETDWRKRGKGHIILRLMELAKPFDPDINSRAPERNLLTPYAVDARYPNFRSVTREEFDKNYHNAEELYEYILSSLQPKINLLKEATNDSA